MFNICGSYVYYNTCAYTYVCLAKSIVFVPCTITPGLQTGSPRDLLIIRLDSTCIYTCTYIHTYITLIAQKEFSQWCFGKWLSVEMLVQLISYVQAIGHFLVIFWSFSGQLGTVAAKFFVLATIGF